MIQSGIAPLDSQLGGLHPGRLHLLTGGPGTGKSTACLQFLQAGLQAGETAALITLDRTDDLMMHAQSLGMDVEAAVRARRLLIARFRAVFGSLIESSGSPATMIADLTAMLAEIRPARLVVDPLIPFLSERSASGAALGALVIAAEELGLTTVVTYPNDVSAGYDTRLAAVVQRAAMVMHLTHADGGARTMRIVQARAFAAPADSLCLQWRHGAGLAIVERKKPVRRAPKREVST